jgi:hypothetical protein
MILTTLVTLKIEKKYVGIRHLNIQLFTSNYIHTLHVILD